MSREPTFTCCGVFHYNDHIISKSALIECKIVYIQSLLPLYLLLCKKKFRRVPLFSSPLLLGLAIIIHGVESHLFRLCSKCKKEIPFHSFQEMPLCGTDTCMSAFLKKFNLELFKSIVNLSCLPLSTPFTTIFFHFNPTPHSLVPSSLTI